MAAVADRLALSARRSALLAWSLIVTAYGNVVAAALGATVGVRGLAPWGSISNTVVYLLFMAAVVGVLVAMGLVAMGARRSTGRERA